MNRGQGEYPNSCNVNIYQDGSQEARCGFHALRQALLMGDTRGKVLAALTSPTIHLNLITYLSIYNYAKLLKTHMIMFFLEEALFF